MKQERVLIGAMGTTDFPGAEYEFPDGTKVISSYFMDALLDRVRADRVIVLLTEEARAKQWEGEDKLKHWFDGKQWSLNVCDIDIPLGQNSTEAWQIFNKIAENVPPNSELYVDITNGLRSIPSLLLSAVRYLVTLRGATVREI